MPILYLVGAVLVIIFWLWWVFQPPPAFNPAYKLPTLPPPIYITPAINPLVP